jgi:hypothetical protein
MAATIQDATSAFKNASFSGPYGNVAKWAGRYTPGVVKGVITDTVKIDICKLPAGSEIDHVSAVFSAIGTAAVMKIGFRWEDTNPDLFVPTTAPTPAVDAFKGATDVSGAGTLAVDFLPVYLPLPAVLTAQFDTSSGANILPSTTDVYIKASGESRNV